MSERSRDLIDLLHAAAQRPATDQHHHVSWLNPLGATALDRLDRAALARKDPRSPYLAIDAVGIDHAWIDSRALDHRAFRSQVALRKSHRAGQTTTPRLLRAHDDIFGRYSVALQKKRFQALAPLATLPPVEHRAQRLARHGQGIFVQQSKATQMKHDFRHAPRQEGPHGG